VREEHLANGAPSALAKSEAGLEAKRGRGPAPLVPAPLLTNLVKYWVDIPPGRLRGLPLEAQLQWVLDEAARAGIELLFSDTGRCSAVRVEVVQGEHTSMLLPPNLEELAARIRTCLERAHVG
jgi:hypothetical protein